MRNRSNVVSLIASFTVPIMFVLGAARPVQADVWNTAVGAQSNDEGKQAMANAAIPDVTTGALRKELKVHVPGGGDLCAGRFDPSKTADASRPTIASIRVTADWRADGALSAARARQVLPG